MLALVDEVKRQLDAELQPDGYNVGFNAGSGRRADCWPPAYPRHPAVPR